MPWKDRMVYTFSDELTGQAKDSIFLIWKMKANKTNSCDFSGITALVWFYLLLSTRLAWATPFSPSEDKASFCHQGYSKGKDEKEKESTIVHFLCLLRSYKLTVVPAIKEAVTHAVDLLPFCHTVFRKNRLDSEMGTLRPYLNCMADSWLRSLPPETSRREDRLKTNPCAQVSFPWPQGHVQKMVCALRESQGTEAQSHTL